MDCGSDHELLIGKIRLKFKKVGKTTRPFRRPKSNPLRLYSESDRLQGFDLIDRVSEELWTELRDIVQETGGKTIPKK